MLSFQDFFAACSGFWTTERTYHYPLKGEIERSYTEFQVDPLAGADKQQILTVLQPADAPALDFAACPGFAIAFDTVSETGEKVSMQLQALFVPEQLIPAEQRAPLPPLPVAAQVAADSSGEVIQGFYLRNEGYSEGGAIAGRFTYQPTRQTLEMTTFYRRSVAVDQMRLVSPSLRLRTIVSYDRPEQPDQPPTHIHLVGFGVEHRRAADPA